jgi:acyl-CoA synthetase (AMP-forming)/AMP-acid ligase II
MPLPVRLFDLLDAGADQYPDREFAVHGARRLTYGEAVAASRRLARGLVERGLEAGDRVAVLSRNSIEMVLLYFAAARVGVVPVPLNHRLAAPEWRYIVDDARARAVFAAGEYIKAIDGLRDGLPAVERLVALDGAGGAGWEAWLDWTAADPDGSLERQVRPEQDLYQMYTSGTTGRPKGAVLTHRAVVANAGQIAGVCQGRPAERSLVVAPLFHAGVVATTFAPIAWGGSLVIVEQFDPGEVVRLLDEERIGFAVLVPAMLQACLAVPDAARRHYRELRLVYYGSSPIAEVTLRRAIAAFRCGLVQSYGLTEAAQALTFLTPADHERALAGNPRLLLSAGRPAADTQVRVVDALDAQVPEGTTGEVVARGPQLMRGYWRLPEATDQTLRGGWLHTGDAGVIDAEGYLYIQDRVRDLIVSGGENIYPREVEEVMSTHPAVAEVAVIGVPDPRWGEAVKAVVARHEGAEVTAEQLIAFCRGRLGGFKLPRSVDFVAALPRNAVGKVLKRQLREPHWSGHRRRVAGA